MNDMSAPRRDKPWMFRTYAGHSTASESNKLYRSNLAKGQTGLSIAFDLPTQTGYDSDHILSRGEVGKVGVPVSHLGDMRTLFDGIPIAEMNTSMTINATAVWLMALYIAAAEEQGAPRAKLQGTTQNDIIKEYLSRGSYVFPPTQSLRLTQDLILFTTKECPKFNPMNVCSYHLQEAGATPSQELAYALATAVAILDNVKKSGEISDEDFAQVALRREGREAPPLPLRRAGQFARSHRAAAGKQRLSHIDRDACGRSLEERAGARRAASGMERGARSAASFRSAMVPAHAADHGL